MTFGIVFTLSSCWEDALTVIVCITNIVYDISIGFYAVMSISGKRNNIYQPI